MPLSSSCETSREEGTSSVSLALIQFASLRIAMSRFGHTDWMNPSMASSARSS